LIDLLYSLRFLRIMYFTCLLFCLFRRSLKLKLYDNIVKCEELAEWRSRPRGRHTAVYICQSRSMS